MSEFINGKLYIISRVTLSHFRSKESTGIHKPCIPAIPRVHLKVDQSVQKNNSPRIHLNVSQESYSFEVFDLSFDLGFVYL